MGERSSTVGLTEDSTSFSKGGVGRSPTEDYSLTN